MPDTPRDYALVDAKLAKLQHLRQLSRLWDNSLSLPGTRLRVGLESLIGLLPIGGDAIGLLLSSYILLQAFSLGLPRSLLIQMLFNILLDGVVGSVPVLGDLFDTAWKANTRNVSLLEAHLRAPTVSPSANRWFGFVLVSSLLLIGVCLMGLGFVLLSRMLQQFKL